MRSAPKAGATVDFKRELGELYAPGREPSIVEVPELSFLMVDGSGDPNTSAAYRDAIQALYSVSYTLKFMLKRAQGFDYRVMPLESLWWTSDSPMLDLRDKSAWNWTAMIFQPERVTDDLVADAIAAVNEKREVPPMSIPRLEPFREGESAQVMHIGPYSEEGPTIARLHEFIAEQQRIAHGKHHEIYLGDPRRTRPERLRTIVRQPVRSP